MKILTYAQRKTKLYGRPRLEEVNMSPEQNKAGARSHLDWKSGETD